MTDPINPLPKGAVWSEKADRPSLSDNDRMILGLSEVMGEFREQMKENLQGRISGELYDPDQDADDFGANEAQRLDDLEARKAKSDAYHAEQSRLYQEKLDMGLLVGSGVKPNLKEIAKHFVRKMEAIPPAMDEISRAAQKTTTAFREVGEKVGQVKKAYVPQPHLTHRPFKTHEMQILREQLRARS